MRIKSRWSMMAVCAAILPMLLGMRVSDVPDPKRTANRFVQDSAGMLSGQDLSRIDVLCQELEKRSSIELAVVTIDNLDGMPVEAYARALFDRFGVGKAGKQNGVLILFARDDRKIRIELGAGVRGMLTDERSGELIDRYAIPRFKAQEFGAGLLALSQALAEILGSESRQGVAPAKGLPAEQGNAQAVSSTAPAQPAVVADPIALEKERAAMEKARIEEEERNRQANLISYEEIREHHEKFHATVNWLAVGIFGFSMLILLLIGFLVGLQRSRAGKLHALGKAWFWLLLLWLGGLLASAITANELHVSCAGPLLAVLIGAVAGTVLVLVGRKLLRTKIQSYQLGCPTCHLPMQMLSEQEDDAKLTPEEVAEEKAGGMDYEFWTCGKCAHLERFEVKLHKASKCPTCSRRTLEKTRVVVSAASTTSSGVEHHNEKCHNPACNYQRTRVHVIPRHSTSSTSYHSSSTFRSSYSSSRSSSSSSSSSSRSSFGGGSSSGGGASRGW